MFRAGGLRVEFWWEIRREGSLGLSDETTGPSLGAPSDFEFENPRGVVSEIEVRPPRVPPRPPRPLSPPPLPPRPLPIPRKADPWSVPPPQPALGVTVAVPFCDGREEREAIMSWAW